MKSTAVIINIALGAIIDEAALLRARKGGWIAGSLGIEGHIALLTP